MAKISVIKEAIILCKEAGITPFIWGHRGLGKSSLVKQLAAAQGWGFIDLRCSQLESSDIRGLPDRIDGRTHYLPPADMPIGDLSDDEINDKIGEKPDSNDLIALTKYESNVQSIQPRYQKGILFIDEVNRAQDDVLQAIFQLVLDRRVGMYVLPSGWCVVAAGNFMEGYLVTGFNDPAFLNRFAHLTLSGGESTLEEWVEYMSTTHGSTATEVIEFASQNIKHLDGEIAGELGFSIQPSRRSWEMVVKVNKATDAQYSDAVRHEVIAGLVGRELALAFTRYSCPVKPKDLLLRGVKKYESALKKLTRNELTGLMWGLVSYCKSQIDDDNVATVCLDFTSFMVTASPDKDVVVAFCRALVSVPTYDKKDPLRNASDKTRAAVISNPKLANLMSEFNKKLGITKKTFVDRLAERPELQQILAKVSWGVTDDTQGE